MRVLASQELHEYFFRYEYDEPYCSYDEYSESADFERGEVFFLVWFLCHSEDSYALEPE